MKTAKKTILTIEDYIQGQDKDKQATLIKIWAIIKKAAPNSIEGIGYQMPVFKQGGVLVYFAAAKNHYGFYPASKAIEVFKKQLDDKGLVYSKGAIQFPIDKPIPVGLVQEIVKFRIKENEIKAAAKKKTVKK